MRANYQEIRDNIDDKFSTIYMDAVDMAEKAGIEPTQPRTTTRQKIRSNNPSETVEQHYRVNLAVPFIDCILENLDIKFHGKT